MNKVRHYQEITSILNNCTETERLVLFGAGAVTVLTLSHMAMRSGYSFRWGSFMLTPSTNLV